MAQPAFAGNYTFIDLGTLGGSGSQAYAINYSGQVVGEAYPAGNTEAHATLFQSTGNIDLAPTTVRQGSEAFSVNQSGKVVGRSYLANITKATRFSGTGISNFNLGSLPDGISLARSINDAGTAVGTSVAILNTMTGFSANHATLFSGTGVDNTDLGTLGGLESAAYDINSAGKIVGSAALAGDVYLHATLFHSTGNLDLGTLGGTSSVAYAINDHDVVVGQGRSGDGLFHAAKFSLSGASPIDLGTLGGTSSVAWDVNNSGVIVGYSQLSNNSAQHGFIYSNGTMTDLNTLIDPEAGITITEARAINDRGQIAATALFTKLNEVHAIRLDPPGLTGTPVTFKIKLSASPSNKGKVTGAGSYAKNKRITVVAKPNKGITFLGWVEGTKSVSKSTSYSFVVTKARTLVAKFK